MGTEGWEIRLDPPVGRVKPTSANVDEPDPWLEAFRSAYDLGEWLEWYRVPAAPGELPGLRAAFVITTSEGAFSLRGSRRFTEPALRFETDLMHHLGESGYPTPRVVRARTGDSFHVDGAGFVVTEHAAVEGYDAEHPQHLGEAARGLGRYHEIVAGFPDRMRAADRFVLSALERSGPHALASVAAAAEATLAPVDCRRLSHACSYLWSQFIRVPEALIPRLAPLRRLVVHGSFGPAALRYEGARLTGVTGFHRAAFDLRAVDLVSALSAFVEPPGVWRGPDSEKSGAAIDPSSMMRRCAEFTAAYRTETDLPDAELELLPLVFRAQRLAKVLAETINLPPDPDRDALRAFVDMAETEGRRLRWLEAGEYDVLAALGSRPGGVWGVAPGLTLEG